MAEDRENQTENNGKWAICPVLNCNYQRFLPPLSPEARGIYRQPRCPNHNVRLIFKEELLNSPASSLASYIFSRTSLLPHSTGKNIPKNDLRSFVNLWLESALLTDGLEKSAEYLHQLVLKRENIRFGKPIIRRGKKLIPFGEMREISQIYTEFLKITREKYDELIDINDHPSLSDKTMGIIRKVHDKLSRLFNNGNNDFLKEFTPLDLSYLIQLKKIIEKIHQYLGDFQENYFPFEDLIGLYYRTQKNKSLKMLTHTDVNDFINEIEKNTESDIETDPEINTEFEPLDDSTIDFEPSETIGVLSQKEKIKKSDIVGTYTIPVLPPEQLNNEIDRIIAENSSKSQKIKDEIKYAILGLHKEISSSILEALCEEINEESRAKSDILYNELIENNLYNEPFRTNNQQVRVISGSSNLGDVSTNLVLDTYKSEWQHLGEKFSDITMILRETPPDSPVNYPLVNFSPVLFNGFITSDIKRRLWFALDWKESHVRGQLRGMRRLMEKTANFPTEWKLTIRNAQQSLLRSKIDKLIKDTKQFSLKDLFIANKILDAFQGNHVLQILALIYSEIFPILGVYPKRIIIDKKKNLTVQTNEIERVLEKMLELFNSNYDNLRESINQIFSLQNNPRIKDVITRSINEYILYQDAYIQFLEANRYRSDYARKEQRILDWFNEDINNDISVLCGYLKCGIFPSEKIVKGLSKLLNPIIRESLPNEVFSCESVLNKLISLIFMHEQGDFDGVRDRLLSYFCNSDATTPPFHSKNNTKMQSPLFLTMGSKYVVERPGNPGIMKELLKAGEKVPLIFTSNNIRNFYSKLLNMNIKTKNKIPILPPEILTKAAKIILERKTINKSRTMKYSTDTIKKIDKNRTMKYSTDTIKIIIKAIANPNSILCELLKKPRVEIKLDFNKNKGRNQLKLRKLFEDDRTKLHPLRILPATPGSKNYNCQLIISGPKECSDLFTDRTEFFKKYNIPIPPHRNENLAIGADENRESSENMIIISLDWNSVKRLNPGRVLQNTENEKEFTSYVNDGDHSDIAVPGVNALSKEEKGLINKNNRLKKHIKPMQSGIDSSRFKQKMNSGKIFTDLEDLCEQSHIDCSRFRALCEEIRITPRNKVHQLKCLRDKRREEIQRLFSLLSENHINCNPLKQRYEENVRSGKSLHNREQQLKDHQNKQKNVRKELKRVGSRLLAMVLASERPHWLGYEELNVNHQGLRGGLATATQYMPKENEILNGVELCKNYYLRKGIPFDIEIVGVNPRGTSQPPHIPSGRSFERTRGNWDIITIPADPSHHLPELKFNSHILSSQKIANLAKETRQHNK